MALRKSKRVMGKRAIREMERSNQKNYCSINMDNCSKALINNANNGLKLQRIVAFEEK